jgi:hypothetical protein
MGPDLSDDSENALALRGLRSLRAAAACLAIACASVVIPTGARSDELPAKSPLFGASVGLGGKFQQGQSLETLPMLKDLKVKWVREHVYWAAVELSPGTYGDLPANLRQQLAYYKANDIGLVALLTLANGKTTPATPAEVAVQSDPDAFGRFAAQAARLLKAEGVRFVLEVGNEPHNSHLVKALGGQWNGKPPSPWLDHYVRMVNAAVREVKAYDPQVKVLAGDDMWVIDYWMLEAGLDPRLDGLTVHPYTPGAPEITAIASDTDWVRPFVGVDPDRSFRSAFTRLRSAATKKLGHPVEIWVTEMGWPVAEGTPPPGGSVPERTVAAYLPRSFMLAAEAGVENFCWFSSQDSVDGPMGLTRNDRSHRMAYDAFKTMTSELGTLRFARRLEGEQGTAATVQTFLFTDDRVDVIAAWHARNVAGSELVVPQGSLRELVVTDLLGVKRTLKPTNGQFTVALDAGPVYVRLASGAGMAKKAFTRSRVYTKAPP